MKAGQRQSGTVMAAHGRHYAVATDDGRLLSCFTRGKKSEAACGDRVEVEPAGDGQGVIAAIGARRNLVYRSDAWRLKLLAANVDQLLVMLAAEPAFSEELLGRALVSAASLEVPALIVLNKTDLAARAAEARERLAPYAGLGYPVIEVSVRTAPEAAHARLWPLLAGRTTLLLGQSGMGKSSLLNLLVPDAGAATREISEALQTGKHTTTFSRRYPLVAADGGAHGALIDTPGFQEFGLAHLTPGQVERAFPELQPFLGQCRFYNCTHLAEPDCAVRQAVSDGRVNERRYALFSALTNECATAHAANAPNATPTARPR